MDTTIVQGHQGERKTPLERLDKILGRLPAAKRSEVWRGLALNLAERDDKDKP